MSNESFSMKEKWWTLFVQKEMMISKPNDQNQKSRTPKHAGDRVSGAIFALLIQGKIGLRSQNRRAAYAIRLVARPKINVN